MLKIIGDGEHARVVREGAREHFASNLMYLTGQRPVGIVAIGDIAARIRAVDEYPGFLWDRVIHPMAILEARPRVGGGTFVGAAAVLQRGSRIGAHVIVGTGAIVEHDVTVGDFCNIGPGVVIGGGASIGERTLLGLGCRIRDHVKVGAGVTVGMGAVVVGDVPDGATVMGVPAK